MNIQKKESSRIFYAFFCVAMRKGVIMSWRKCRNKLFALGLSALMWGNTFPGAVWASDLEMQNTTVQEQENVMEGELQEKSEIQESGSQDTDESGTKMPESKISESEILETEISKETQESKLKQKEEVEKAGLEKEEVEKTKMDKQLEIVYQDLEEKMKQILGTKVSINAKDENKGKIEIEYYNKEDLDRLIDMILK